MQAYEPYDTLYLKDSYYEIFMTSYLDVRGDDLCPRLGGRLLEDLEGNQQGQLVE